ncbi:hypothetical protein ACIQXU_16365 [Peribacillus sp. NPDC097284]|uniref:hypothetical protein n=1 Tax=Peribacillus sp. NPDC097284 TaxID=3364401 RepID=UPI00381E74FC
MTKISLNGVVVDAYDFSDDLIPNEFNGNIEVRTLQFYFNVYGLQNFNLYSNLVGNSEINIKSEELNIDEKFNIKNHMSRYTGELDEDTLITFKLELTEIVELEDEPNIFVNLGQEIVYNRIRVRALTDLLIENDLISKEEYLEKIDLVEKENFEIFKKELLYGINQD